MQNESRPDQDVVIDRTWSVLCHLGALTFVIIPLGNLIVPALIWYAKRDQDRTVDLNGRESLNFQFTLLFLILVLLVISTMAVGAIVVMGFQFPGSYASSSANGSTFSSTTMSFNSEMFPTSALNANFKRFIVPLSALVFSGVLFVFLVIANFVMIFVNAVKAYGGQSPSYWPRIRFIRPS